MDDFHKILNVWYGENRRNLPWRDNKSPYSVWVSEIILQQTRVQQGLAYYLRFIERFPDVQSLASASEEDVLLLWQGLGYYSRARNLHYAARQIVKEYNGKFPDSFAELKKLKGIGDYTAAAIASISLGHPYPVIDGNVFRVLSRIFGIYTPIDTNPGKKEFSALADILLDNEDPGTYNEAIMDFGALQCTPNSPDCLNCPFENKCIARINNQVGALPVKSRQPNRKLRYFNYLFIRYKEKFYLQKRESKDIWHNLYQLPLIEKDQDTNEMEIISSPEFNKYFYYSVPLIESITPLITHNLTHQKLQIRFFEIRIDNPMDNPQLIMVSERKASDYPLPKPIKNFLDARP